MKPSINLRFLLASLLCFGLFGVAAYFVHGVQVRRQSDFLLDRARNYSTERQFQPALRDYQRYLELAPKDFEAHAEYGLLLAERGQSAGAAGHLETALRSVPERHEWRRKLAEIDLALKRYSAARDHLQLLLAAFPGEGRLWEQLGICQETGGHDSEAAESFQKAITIDPQQCESYAHLAAVLRLRPDRDQEADECMDNMVRKNPGSAAAHLLRAQYLHQRSNNREKLALADVEKAVELGEKDANTLLLAATLCESTGDYDKMCRYAQRAITADPTLADGYLALSRGERHSNSPEKAVQSIRRGIDKASDRWKLLWDLGQVMIDQGDLNKASEAIRQLRGLPASVDHDPVLIDYLQAQIEAARGHWHAAARAFADVARQSQQPLQNSNGHDMDSLAGPHGRSSPELLREVQLRMARCYGQLGDADAQLAAYAAAARTDPLSPTARLGVADTLFSLGKVGQALEEYRQVGRLEGMAGQADFQVARLLTLKNLRLPARERDWKEVDAIVDRLQRARPDATELLLLRAETLFARGRADETEKLLTAARDKHPAETELWSALVSFAMRRQEWDRAIALLDEAEKRFGDRVFLRLARGQYLLTRHGQKAAVELVKLGADASRFSPQDRLQLCGGLAIFLLEAGDLEQAKQLAGRACDAARTNLAIRLVAFELAYLSKDMSGMEKVLGEIRSFEPEGALWHYGEALRLAVLSSRQPAGGKQAGELQQAIEHLSLARAQRPGWGRIPLLAGRLYDQLGEVDAAIDNYCQAMDLGEIDPRAARRAFELLYNRQRYAEADARLRQLQQSQGGVFSVLGRMASAVSLRLEDFDRAVGIARQVADKSKDWADHAWLGELESLQGQRALADQFPTQAKKCFQEAERSFRRAVELGPESPETWVGLIRFLAATDQKATAQTELEKAIKKIPAEKAALALGPCYEALGNVEEAAKQYQSVLAKGAKDPRVLRNVAEYCIRVNKPTEAEDYLQRILTRQVPAKAEDLAWARRATARILRQRGGYANLLKAVALIDQNLAGAAGGLDDLREKAVLLAGFPQRAKRLEGIEALEQVVRSQPEMTEVRFSLAQMYLREKNWIKTKEHMLALLANHGKEVRFLAAYAAMLMDRNEIEEARIWLDRLQDLAAKNSTTLLLQADFLVRQKQVSAALALIDKLLKRPLEKPDEHDAGVLKAVSILKITASGAGARGDKAAQIRLFAEMERLVRDYVTRHPDKKLLLAFALLQSGRVDEALDIAERSWPKADVNELVEAAMEMLGQGGPNPVQFHRAENILLSIAEKKGRPPWLLLAIGSLEERERPKEAVETYREVLKKDPNNVAALNNLAFLLALQKQNVEESLKLVERAIAIAGPVPAMLDTRAVVRLAGGHGEEALADLDEAIREDPRPARYLHRALACWRLGRQTAATEAFGQARKLGLKPEGLSVIERHNYEELARNLPP